MYVLTRVSKYNWVRENQAILKTHTHDAYVIVSNVSLTSLQL